MDQEKAPIRQEMSLTGGIKEKSEINKEFVSSFNFVPVEKDSWEDWDDDSIVSLTSVG